MKNDIDILVRCITVAMSLVGLLAAEANAQHETVRAPINIEHPSVMETSQQRAIVNLTIGNSGLRADRLLRAAASIAEDVVIFDQVGNEGNGLPIPGLSELILGAGTPRIELIGVTRALKSPDTFNLLLVFRDAGKIVVKVIVEDERSARH
jgi:copper(I)-binding protein